MQGQYNHRGCTITWSPLLGAFVWDSETWDAKSTGTFNNLDEAKADFDAFLAGYGFAPDADIEAALAQLDLESQP